MTPRRTTVRVMEFETITYDVQDRVGRLHFDRPEGANAVSPTFARELREAMLRIHYDDGVKSVAVTAEGKVFCAGGDLKLFHAWGCIRHFSRLQWSANAALLHYVPAKRCGIPHLPRVLGHCVSASSCEESRAGLPTKFSQLYGFLL